jgi:AP-1-like factor
LEHKSFGVSVENENLRGILKRLQEENVALKQSAFTFSMPVGSSPQNGQKSSGNGTDTPTGRAAGQNGPMAQIGKPPTPSHTMSDDSLKSINEVSSFSNQPARQKSNQSSPTYDSPDSLVSIGSGNGFSSETSNSNQVNLFGNSPMDFGNVSSNSRPSLTSLPSSGSSNPVETPKSTTSTNNGTEIDALWASFMQQNRPQQPLPAQTQPAWNTNTPNMLGAAQPLAFADDNTKVCDKPVNTWDKSAFRDVTAPAADVSAPQAQQFEARAAPAQADPWSNVMDSSVNEFLASLTGANGEVNDNFGTADDDFNAQLQQILGVDASPSAPFSLPGNPFSPTNYLNMSPSPNASGSNGTSPQSVVSQSASNYASPDSTSTGPTSASGSVASGSSVGQKYTPGLATFGPPKSDAEHVHIVDEAGNIIPPSEVWMRSGMKDHPGMLDHLLLDDLCDQMRAKATCKDGKFILPYSSFGNLC